jgi:hypothetical protein
MFSADVGLGVGGAHLNFPVGFIVVLSRWAWVWAGCCTGCQHGAGNWSRIPHVARRCKNRAAGLARQHAGPARGPRPRPAAWCDGSSVPPTARAWWMADGLAQSRLVAARSLDGGLGGHAFGESGGAVLGVARAWRRGTYLLRLEDGTAVRVWAPEAADRKLLQRWSTASPPRLVRRPASRMGGLVPRRLRVAPADENRPSWACCTSLARLWIAMAASAGDRAARVCWTVTGGAREACSCASARGRSRVDELGPLQVDAGRLRTGPQGCSARRV